MCEITEKLGVKVFVILLFSVFILAGLSVTQAYGQPLDTPLYNHANTRAVKSMSPPADTKLVTNVDSVYPCTLEICHEQMSVPVMSVAGEIVFILTLTGGACWAIIRKKRP